MVPCQPRQLVIWSLPFAALVAFFLFRRKKSSSHSDPGGTLSQTKPVDNAVNSCNQKVIEKTDLTVPDSEKLVSENIENVAGPKTESIVDEPVITPVIEKLTESVVKQEKIVCNGYALPAPIEVDLLNIEYKELDNPATPNFETNSIFHSTTIEEEKTLDESEHNIYEQNKIAVEETVNSCDACEIETAAITFNDISVREETVDSRSVLEEKVKKIIVPVEEQSTVENIALKDNVFVDFALEDNLKTEEASDKVVDKNSEVGTLEVTEKELELKHILSKNSDTLEGVENISTDTGLGSQELSVENSNSSMAQGQKTKEKTQSNAAGLEQKLASLGLDTQQPGQRAERDSANHSPAEVMLNSPAISTYSDAHSEGSSDSGKGCSDVVTPPSVTPAGGSSVAGDQVPIIYEFVLPQVIVGRLIGRHGTFLHDIRAKTHTNVFIKRHPETNSLKICAIEGTQPDIDAALKMIRQKFPLRRFPELTLDRVTFVKNSCLPINPENLQLHLVEGVNNDVLLSSLITAGHFFLQMPMHMSYQSLYKLACIMNSVYNTQESPPLPDPQPDVVCVAPAQGGWYRAQILSVDEEAHTSDIRFLDYGGFLTVDNNSLRQIRGDFLMLPFQAVECVLANVLPAGGVEEWSDEANQFMQVMTAQQTLQAQVYDYTDTGLPLIYLYCTQFFQSPTDPIGLQSKVVLLNEELVSRGYAELMEVVPVDGQTDTCAAES